MTASEITHVNPSGPRVHSARSSASFKRSPALSVRMDEPIPDCSIHRRAIEMVRTSAHINDRFDREPTVAECHTCRICQLAREFAYLRSEEEGGRVSRRRRDSPAVWNELQIDVNLRHGRGAPAPSDRT
jgi:hypothetical protein